MKDQLVTYLRDNSFQEKHVILNHPSAIFRIFIFMLKRKRKFKIFSNTVCNYRLKMDLRNLYKKKRNLQYHSIENMWCFTNMS